MMFKKINSATVFHILLLTLSGNFQVSSALYIYPCFSVTDVLMSNSSNLTYIGQPTTKIDT